MRIVTEGDQLSIEAELDGPIAVGFEHWREANAFLDRIVAEQIGVFI